MKMSEKLDQIAPAIAKAQSAMRRIEPKATNPHLRTKYARIADIWDELRETLGEHGLSVIQTTDMMEDGTPVVECMLLHESGQWLAGRLAIPYGEGKGTTDAQKIGSAISYARRYTLCAIVGATVADEDDDDGSGAGSRDRGKNTWAAEAKLEGELTARVAACTTMEMLGKCWEDNQARIGKLAPDNVVTIKAMFSERKAALRDAPPTAAEPKPEANGVPKAKTTDPKPTTKPKADMPPPPPDDDDSTFGGAFD